MTAQPIYTEVIVGTDGSGTATGAVRAAVALAATLGVQLSIATAWYRPDQPPPSEASKVPGGSVGGHEARWADETVSEAAGIARQAGVEDVHVLTPSGNAADALVRLADERPGALVVVGTRGLDRVGERLVGNIPHQLTHHCASDLLLVTDREHDARNAWQTVGLATDGSPTAALACEHGYALAGALDASPTLLTVARDEESGTKVLDRAAGQFEDTGNLDRRVFVGRDVSRTLVDAGDEFDLLVIGNKGMSGPSRLLGSVSNRVTHEVPTDLLLVNTTR